MASPANPTAASPIASGVAQQPTPAWLSGDPRMAANKQQMMAVLARRKALQAQGLTADTSPELRNIETWFQSMMVKMREQQQQQQQQGLASGPAVNGSVANGAVGEPPSVDAGATTMPTDGFSMDVAQQAQLKVQIVAYKYLQRNLALDERLRAALANPRAAVELVQSGQADAVLAKADDLVLAREKARAEAEAAAAKEQEGKGKGEDAMQIDDRAKGKERRAPEPGMDDDDPTLDAGSTVYPYNAYSHPRDAMRHAAKMPLTNQRAVTIPALLPPGLDPYTLKEQRERFLEGRMRWRIGELMALKSDLGMEPPPEGEEGRPVTPALAQSFKGRMPSGHKLRALIELKSLQLLPRQRHLRQEIVSGLEHATTLSLVPDRSAFRRVRKHALKDARATEQIERAQKAEREQKAKQQHLDHLSSVRLHGRALHAAHAAWQEKVRKVGRTVLRFHSEAEKEEQKRLERMTKARLNALRENDEETYRMLVDSAKDTRLHHLLRQTDSYLDKLSEAVLKQQGQSAPAPPRGEGFDESTFGAAPVFEEEARTAGQKADYYNIAHKFKEEVTKQSTYLVGGQLKEYQIKGLQWMVSLYNNRLNGILADEMGLGKTIQTISLITYLIEHKRQRGPYLVIVPLSTIPNWTLEFEKWAPSVSVLCYKGSPLVRKQLQAGPLRQQNFTVLLTTYEYIIKDRPALSKIRWVHMIIDEGHRMKNSQSKLSQTLVTYYTSQYRLILTGTPLQNNLPELWALLNFVLPKVFNEVRSFEDWFNAPFANSGSNDKIELSEEESLLVIRRLHKVLRPFLLRRLKKDVESELPEKTERVVKCKMSALQAKLTNMLMTHKVIFADEGATNAAGQIKGQRGLQNILMQLKKLCNHPFVFEQVELEVNGVKQLTDDTIWRAAGKFELLDRILPKLFKTGHRILMFFQMTNVMDVFQDYCAYRNIPNLRLDGTTKPEDRAQLLQIFNAPDCEVNLFLLSTRAGGLGLNLQTADTVVIFDSDWNPHQDLQAQDRAHRIGQKKEVRVLRLITSKTVEEHIMEKANFKLEMDKKVIQAGRFDNKSSEKEREAFLRELLEANEADDDDADELNDEELNEILARTDDEAVLFAQMDKERARDELRAWKATPAGRAGKPLPERLMTVEELPAVYAKEHVVKTKEVLAEEEELAMRKPRVRNVVHYTDGLTDDQFAAALEDPSTDLATVIERKRARKVARNAKKGRYDDEDDDESSSVASIEVPSSSRKGRGRNSRVGTDSPAPDFGRKRKRGGTAANSSIDPSVADEDEVRPKGKKRKANGKNGDDSEEDGINDKRRAMRECYDALMKPMDPESKTHRIDLFRQLVSRKTFADYYQIIRKPISMQQIHKGIQQKYSTMEQFKDDIYLMFQNARTYNETGSYVYTQADELQKVFDDVYHRLVDEYGNPRARPLKISLSKKRAAVPDSESEDEPMQDLGSNDSDED